MQIANYNIPLWFIALFIIPPLLIALTTFPTPTDTPPTTGTEAQIQVAHTIEVWVLRWGIFPIYWSKVGDLTLIYLLFIGGTLLFLWAARPRTHKFKYF